MHVSHGTCPPNPTCCSPKPLAKVVGGREAARAQLNPDVPISFGGFGVNPPFSPVMPFQNYLGMGFGSCSGMGTSIPSLSPSHTIPEPSRARRDLTNFLRQELLSAQL